jgi:hypothetical protein
VTNLATRYVAIDVESTYGAGAASIARIYGEVDEESIAHAFDLMMRDDFTRKGTRKSVEGTKYTAGDLTFAMLGDQFTGRLIANAFGANSHSGSGPYTNTLTETSNDAGFDSFEVFIGRDGKGTGSNLGTEYRYPGMVLDSLTIGANINEYVMCSASFVGCGMEDAENAPVDPSNSDLHSGDAFHFLNTSIKFEGNANVSTRVKSVELSINLNRDTDNAYALGNVSYTRAPPPQKREITGTIEFNQMIDSQIAERDEPFFKELSAGLLVDGTASSPAITLTFAGGTNENLEIKLFKVQYDPPSANINGRDTMTMSVSFTALYDEGENAMSSAVWTTTDSTAVLG